jgi:hypothetical protein
MQKWGTSSMVKVFLFGLACVKLSKQNGEKIHSGKIINIHDVFVVCPYFLAIDTFEKIVF